MLPDILELQFLAIFPFFIYLAKSRGILNPEQKQLSRNKAPDVVLSCLSESNLRAWPENISDPGRGITSNQSKYKPS